MIDNFRRLLSYGGNWGVSSGGGGRTLADYVPINGVLGQAVDPLTRNLLQRFDHDDEKTRQLKYARYFDYYENGQYSTKAFENRSRERLSLKGSSQADIEQLYNFTKSFYNPVTSAVDVDVDSVFRDPTHFEALQASQQGALDKVLRYSRFDTRRMEIVRYGSMTGDVYARVFDDWENKAVKVYVYSPDICRVITNPHDKDKVDYAVIQYQYVDQTERTPVRHTRTELLFADVIRTFRDGVSFGYDDYPSEVPNKLGVVPIRHIKNLSLGGAFGIPTFNHVLPTLDVVNEIFSFIANIVKMNADPVMLAYGIPQGTLTKGSETDPHAQTIWYIPVLKSAAQGGEPRLEMFEWKGNLPDVMAMLKEVKEGIVDSLPELHLGKMQQQGAYSGFALNAMLFTFIQKATRMRLIYREGVEEILSMALAATDMIAGTSSAFDYMDPKYQTKAVIPTVLPVDEDAQLNRVIAKLEAHLIGPEDALLELGYPKDDIAEILRRADEHAQAMQDMVTQANIQTTNARTRLGQNNNGQANAAAQSQGRGPAGQQAAKGVNHQPLNQQLASQKGK